jgi:hypothetical protein
MQKTPGLAFFPVASDGAALRVTAAETLRAAAGADLRAFLAASARRGRGVGREAAAGGATPPPPPPPPSLRRSGAPQQPLSVFPPVFDTRLYYRFAHEPYAIEDQEDCASCVFIAAATCAKVRGGVQSDLPVMNAARVWRQLLREAGGGEAGAEAQAYRRAAERFVEVMCARAAEAAGSGGGAAAAAMVASEPKASPAPRTPAGPGREAASGKEATPALLSPSARPLPPLDWRRFICCGGGETHEVCGRRSRPEQCYHHRDGDPREAAFHCARHSEGVVPLHFVEWVSGVGFHCRESGALVVDSISPERSEGFALTEPVQAEGGELGEAEARAMAEQVRRMKTSLLTHGPLMAMMKIDGRSFDAWGRPGRSAEPSPSTSFTSSSSSQGRSLYARQRGSEAAAAAAARRDLGGSHNRIAGESWLRGEPEGEVGASEGRAGVWAAEAARAPKEVPEAAERGEAEGERGEAEGKQSRAGAGVAAKRAGYVLPDTDAYDEFHEVTVVGWGFDDDGVPCWVVLNSYGEEYNDACVPSGRSVSDPWLSSLLDAAASRGYGPSGVAAKGGAVFVRMMSPEMLQQGRSTDLENNVIAFVPRLPASLRSGAAPPFYDPMGKRVHVAAAGGEEAPFSRAGAAGMAGLRASFACGSEAHTTGEGSRSAAGAAPAQIPGASWMVAAGVAGAVLGAAVWGSVRGMRRRG